jgi:hypothetical protein
MRLASYVPGELIPLLLSGSIPELPHSLPPFFGEGPLMIVDFGSLKNETPQLIA